MPPPFRLSTGPPLPAVLSSAATSSTYPPVPTIDELLQYSIALGAARAAAENRAAVCREGARLQQDAIAKVARRAEDERRGKEKERVERDRKKREDSIRREAEVNVKKEDDRRRKDREINGTVSPTIRVKRELSASPAPTHNGDYNTQLAQQRKKKRKLDHIASTASPEIGDRAELPGRSGSRFNSPGSEHPSTTPSIPNLKVKLKVAGDAPPKLGRPPSSVSLNLSEQTPPPAHPSINFSIPSSSSRSLVPPRPPIPPPPKPGPKRQKDVNEDFSHSKQHNNPVQLSTFWTTVEHYLRDVSEDDLAMLGFRANDPEPFTIPPLGRHYQDVWDEEDALMPFSAGGNAVASSSAVTQDTLLPRDKRQANRPRKFVPARDMTDADLTDDLKGLGPLAERLLGAMFRLQQDSTEGRSSPNKQQPAVQPAEDPGGGNQAHPPPSSAINGLSSSAVVGGSAGNDPSRSRQASATTPASTYDWPIQPHRIPNRAGDKERASCSMVDMSELEEGLKREMRHLGILNPDEEVDFTMRQDDEITAALRQCQRLLRQQLAVNDARKNRLAEVARDRLAYGDYRHTLSGLEAVITTAWQRRSSRKVRKGKSKEKEKEKEEVYVMGGKKAPGSALPDQVKKAMEARRKWIDSVGAALEGEDMEGRYKGLPTRSIYEGIDDQIRDAGAVGDK